MKNIITMIAVLLVFTARLNGQGSILFRESEETKRSVATLDSLGNLLSISSGLSPVPAPTAHPTADIIFKDVADGFLKIQKSVSDGGSLLIIGAGGSGDVVGPISSIDNYVPVFSGTTGKIIKQPITTAVLSAISLILDSSNVRIEDGGCDAGISGLDTLCNNSGVFSVRHGTGTIVPLEGTSEFQQDPFTPTLGQTVFSLSQAFLGTPGISLVLVNNLAYVEGTNYTISGTTLTWLDTPFTLDGSDSLVAVYQIQ
jgi:hypothetical protein